MSKPYDIRFDLEAHEGQNILHAGRGFQAVMHFTPNEDIELTRLGVGFYREAKGMMVTQRDFVYHHRFAEKPIYRAGQTYSFPVSVPPLYHESYQGFNVDITFGLSADIKIEGEGTGQKILNFFKSFTDPGWRQDSMQVELRPREDHFVIEEQTVDLRHKNFFVFFIVLFILLVVGSVALKNYVDIKILASISGGIMALSLGFLLLGNHIASKLQARIKRNGNRGFQAQIINEKRWRFVKGLDAHFKIVEEVIDNRGTSTSTSHNIIYDRYWPSENQLSGPMDFYFEFPTGVPPSTSWGDVSIIWQIELVMRTIFGFPVRVSAPFQVERKKIIISEGQ